MFDGYGYDCYLLNSRGTHDPPILVPVSPKFFLLEDPSEGVTSASELCAFDPFIFLGIAVTEFRVGDIMKSLNCWTGEHMPRHFPLEVHQHHAQAQPTSRPPRTPTSTPTLQMYLRSVAARPKPHFWRCLASPLGKHSPSARAYDNKNVYFHITRRLSPVPCSRPHHA